MDTSEVPMELWEQIIDLVGIKSNTDPIVYYPAVRSCCLVCSCWLPRSRYNLFSTVSITEELLRSGFNRVYCLARTVCESSDLAYLINELQIWPRTPGRAVPLAVSVGPGSWATSMLSLRSLKLVGVGWYPVLYNATISQFPTPLVRLELERVAFDRATSLFYLIWSLPHLVCVVLHHVTIPNLSQMNFKKLSSTRPKAVVGCLTKLTINGTLADEEHFPPPGAFGKALRKVHLEFSSRHWHHTGLRAMLEMSTSLEEFQACIHLSGDGVTAPDKLCSELMSLLLKSPVIRLVKLALLPSSFKVGYGGTFWPELGTLMRLIPAGGYLRHYIHLYGLGATPRRGQVLPSAEQSSRKFA